MINFIKKNFIYFIAFLLLAGTIFFILHSSIEVLISNILPDDAFYYFQVARNISNGLGSTFDGAHLTNGYHPLWMGINIVVYKLVGSSGDIFPIKMILIVESILMFLALLTFWKILLLFGHDNIFKKVIFLLVLFNPFFSMK